MAKSKSFKTLSAVRLALGLQSTTSAVLLSSIIGVSPSLHAQTKSTEKLQVVEEKEVIRNTTTPAKTTTAPAKTLTAPTKTLTEPTNTLTEPTKTLTAPTKITTTTPVKTAVLSAELIAKVKTLQSYTLEKTQALAIHETNTDQISKQYELSRAAIETASAQIKALQENPIKSEREIATLKSVLEKQQSISRSLLSESLEADKNLAAFKADLEKNVNDATATFAKIAEPTAEIEALKLDFKNLSENTTTLKELTVISASNIKQLQENTIKLQTSLSPEMLGVSAPIASNSTSNIKAGAQGNIALSALIRDPDGDTAIDSVDLNPDLEGQQNVIPTDDGTWSVDERGALTFVPSPSFEGKTQISYTVQDTGNRESNVATLTVIVDGATPVAASVALDTESGTTASVDLSKIISDSNNDIVLSSLDLDPSTKGAQQSVDTKDGIWSIDSGGVLKFIPSVEFEGNATATYVVQDDDGNQSLPASVAVKVAGAVPVARSVAVKAASHSVATIDLSEHVSDANNDIVLASMDVDPTIKGTQNTITTPAGTWVTNKNGIITFDPVASFQGDAVIYYTAQDDDGNISSPEKITVNVPGVAPVVTAAAATIDSGATTKVNLSDNVTDANNNAVISSIDIDPATKGQQSVLTTVDGDWSISESGILSFTPAKGFEGVAQISYAVQDTDNNVSSTALVMVTVNGATPVTTTDSTTVDTDTLAVLDISDNVSDANNDVVISSVDLDPGTPGKQLVMTSADGSWTVNNDGDLTFDPAPDFEGTASISYTVEDDDGNISNTSVVTVNVNGAAPVATADGTVVDADTVANIDLADNVSDANNDIVISSIDLDTDKAGTQQSVSKPEGEWTVDAAGNVTFEPLPGFEGVASISYTVTDDDGNTSAGSNVSVTVAGATPVATDESVTVAPDTTAAIDLTDNVSDSNDDIVLNSIDLNPEAQGIQTSLTTVDGDWSYEAGELQFDPVSTFEGDTAILYTVSDDDNNVSEPATITVTVNSASPIADSDFADGIQDTDTKLNILGGDTDANNDIDVSTIDLNTLVPGIQSTFTQPDEGEFNIVDGHLVFTPAPGFYGTVNVDYTVNDANNNLSNVATATINILADTDGDGVPDITDIDDDNDGLLDVVETVNDQDGDAIANLLDRDSDNDGLTDALEAGIADTDGDGIVDGFTDDNNDGYDDTLPLDGLLPPDTDGDNLANFLDIDSDNDGLTDTQEANSNDDDADGVVDNFTDLDNDGRDDATAATPLHGIDTDQDGVKDHHDLDSDNDGLTDTLEAGGTDADANGIIDDFADADNNGFNDTSEAMPLPVPDTDNDGLNDHLDLDSDNDGLTDTLEAGGTDADANGNIDNFADADNNGLNDTSEAMPLPVPDTDNDNLANHLDLDSDNDALTDAFEAGGDDHNGDGAIDNFTDSNSDGLDDVVALMPLPAPDSDNDGVEDHLDVDADNDGLSDTTEAGGADNDGDGTIDDFIDADNNGFDDTTSVNALPVPDSDNDGVVNHLDTDSDGDGVPDAIEGNPDSDSDGTPDYLDFDADDDGIPDGVEAAVSNSDRDDDGIDDVFDADVPDGTDTNQDGVGDQAAALGLPDTDSDGVVDMLDTDSDNDTIPDSVEAGVNPITPIDSDADSIADFQELDSDNDGIPDTLEVGSNPDKPADRNANGIPDYMDLSSDYDGDGLSDSIEGIVDTDNDSIPDYQDEDSDNDSISDAIEATFANVTPADKDQDNIPDYIDVDADNDGISDALEGELDTDADGVADFRDLDVDNDGILDIIEARIGMEEVNQLDTDLDGTVDTSFEYGTNGMADIVESEADTGIENYTLPDIDDDGVLDYRDLDSDNDGLFDTFESNHPDADFDGVIDSSRISLNRVRSILAVSQATGLTSGAGRVPPNSDQDGLADFRDGDSDNDGLLDVVESFGISADFDQDGEYDGFIDTDGDGVNDIAYMRADKPTDTDADGTHDAIQLDSDADGIYDLIENGGLDTDSNGMLDDFLDDDNDGVDDAMSVIPVTIVDTDNDSKPDFQDLDSDNDGLSDILESGGTDANGDNKADNPVSAAALPDTNQNNIPDYQEIGFASPQPAPIVAQVAEPDVAAANGAIQTGLSGTGCFAGSGNAKDPTLPALLVLSMLALLRRLGLRKPVADHRHK